MGAVPGEAKRAWQFARDGEGAEGVVCAEAMETSEGAEAEKTEEPAADPCQP